MNFCGFFKVFEGSLKNNACEWGSGQVGTPLKGRVFRIVFCNKFFFFRTHDFWKCLRHSRLIWRRERGGTPKASCFTYMIWWIANGKLCPGASLRTIFSLFFQLLFQFCRWLFARMQKAAHFDTQWGWPGIVVLFPCQLSSIWCWWYLMIFYFICHLPSKRNSDFGWLGKGEKMFCSGGSTF